MTKRENCKGKYNLNLPERVSQIAKSDMTENTETLILTAEQAFKSKKNFEDFMRKPQTEIINTLNDYPQADGKVIVTTADLTQSSETFVNALTVIQNLKQPPFIVWIVANEKENLVKSVKSLNSFLVKGCGIFLFKACLNGNKMAFEILAQPSKTSKRNSGTDTKQLQLKYWTKYFEICDSLECDLQVKPASQHWQYIPIGKAGVSIQLTINTQQNYVGCELLINNNKEFFYTLEKLKEKIEKQLGELDWQELKGKKSSRIRKVYSINMAEETSWETAVKEQIRMVEEFKSTFTKYL